MAKAKTPQPIDRPLSRAYLREFTGWSSAYPPGISDPTSLRIMENVMIQRDGSVRIRPGLRYISYESDLATPISHQPVGSHEPFFLNDGTKAYLFAVREDDDTVGFRVLANLGAGQLVHTLTEAEIDFRVPQGEAALAFSSETTYVKYLQIDNKIFALSNAGEPMRYFEVGTAKLAKALSSISLPGWTTGDKLTVVQPPKTWVDGLAVTAQRTNFCVNPNFETDMNSWEAPIGIPPTVWTQKVWSGAVVRSGSRSMRLNPARVGDTVTVQSVKHNVTAGLSYAFSAYMRAGSTTRSFKITVSWYTSADVFISSSTGASTSVTSGAWARVSHIATAPATAGKAYITIQATAASASTTEWFYVDDVLFEQSATVDAYFDGGFTDSPPTYYDWAGTSHASASTESVYTAADSIPTAATPTADTLISSTPTDNSYNFGFFYTFANEVGESAASQITVVKAQRGWSQLKWETPNVASEPSGTSTTDPTLCADQLVAYMPEAVYDQALVEGATKWYLYVMTWSDQDPVPTTAIKIATVDLVSNPDYDSDGWAALTPQQADISAEIAALPSESTRFNFSDPSRAGQGIVAADRMVMVYDPVAPAVIRWSSNEQGSYTDFSAAKGGGYKTLTSGNMFVPAVVKLWQNPQSVDTLTILCLGVDGRSTGYYMAPSQVASQSEAVNIMGFEETTATPGTTSPYGCEVLNNALYHPLDEMLMKSSATNYNINHLALTDQIQNKWRALVDKHHIVSSQLDNRLYYLVHNPDGEELEDGCWGNEVWVYDAAQKAGSWSRWLVQGQSLRKFEQGGRVVMSITRPDGMFYFDEDYARDDYVGYGNGNLLSANQASAETDADDWRTTGLSFAYTHATWAQSSAQAVHGTSSVKATWPVSGVGSFGSFVGTEIEVVVGETYTFSCYVYVPSGSPDVAPEVIPISAPGQAGNSTDHGDLVDTKDEWVRLTHTFTAEAQYYILGVKIEATDTGGECYIDAAQLESGSEMSSFNIGGNLCTENQASAETDVSDWSGDSLFGTYPDLPTIAQSAVRAVDGTKSVELTWPATAVGSFGRVDVTGLVVGQTYTASLYVYVPTNSPDVRINVGFYASGELTSVKDEWVRLSVTWVAEVDHALLGVDVVGAADAGDKCYVDALQIEPGDTMSAFTTNAAALTVVNRPIPWRLETNTQGANRAHDAWAHLQQANVVLGNFQGTMRYGIRGRDINGRTINRSKVVRDDNAPSSDGTLWDLEDYMSVQRDMKEWFFYASSETGDAGETLASSGQINLVQYRYTPVSVNTGYEYGSVETFEYGRAGNAAADRNTDNGIPMPFIDTGRP